MVSYIIEPFYSTTVEFMDFFFFKNMSTDKTLGNKNLEKSNVKKIKKKIIFMIFIWSVIDIGN